MKLGVLDLGSNTTKLLVAEAKSEDSFEVLLEKSSAARMNLLGQGNGKFHLSQESIEAVSEVVADLFSTAQELSVEHLIAVGTDALRLAQNQNELSEKLGQVGVKLRILSGEEEARYVSLGLLSDPVVSNQKDLVGFDLGGGSLEVIGIRNRIPTSFHSLPLGAVRMKQRFENYFNSSTEPGDFDEIEAYLSEAFAKLPKSLTDSGFPLVGSGGALVFSRKLVDSFDGRSGVASEIKLRDLIFLLERLNGLSPEERTVHFPGLPKNRADILPAGLTVVVEWMRFMKQDFLIHSFRNLRFGIAQEFFNSARA